LLFGHCLLIESFFLSCSPLRLKVSLHLKKVAVVLLFYLGELLLT
jgi:hypothetical protein